MTGDQSRASAESDRLTLFMSREEIAAVVAALGSRLRDDYAGKDPLLIGVLRGSFIFLADLVRVLDIPAEVEFIRAASYQGTMSSGRVRTDALVGLAVRGRHVILVEDIIDTGLTTARVLDALRRRGAASLAVCTLLDKPARRHMAIRPDYVGATVPDRFLVGYGLDHDQRYRNLPDLYILSPFER